MGATDSWDPAAATPRGQLARQSLSARSVELIAQPSRIHELRDCVQGPLMNYLRKLPGFAGVIVLNSVKEPRLILVMSLWNGEKHASSNRWESSATVLKMISPLIDVCSRVHTYDAAMPVVVASEPARIAASLC